MARRAADLATVLRKSKACQELIRKCGVRSTMRFIDSHEHLGSMSPEEVAVWRCRLHICWAEGQRRSRVAPRPRGGGRVLRFTSS